MDDRHIITAVRLACLAVFLCCAIQITWQSVIAFGVLTVSVTLLQPRQQVLKVRTKFLDWKKNPLKGKPRVQEEDLAPETTHYTLKKISDFVLHNAEETNSLQNFSVAKENSQCLFAKQASFWGSRDWEPDKSLEENIYRNLANLVKFTCLCDALGLDGFLFELPGKLFGQNVKEFGDAVRRILKCISDHDPAGRHCMNHPRIDIVGWVFEFNKITFFVTTFAPFYPETSSRYLFGSDNCYIVLQPEISFAQHDVPYDTPHTNWDHPKTIRDRIRVGFKEAGRLYLIRETVTYPMVYDMVKPLEEGDDSVQWWKES